MRPVLKWSTSFFFAAFAACDGTSAGKTVQIEIPTRDGAGAEKTVQIEVPTRDEVIAEYEELKSKALETQGGGHPALWRMVDEDTTIYFLGTVHILPNDLEWQNDVITDAFERSNTVYFEVDQESQEAYTRFSNLLRENGYLKSGDSIYDYLSADNAKVVKNALSDINFAPEAIDNLQPWNASMEVYQYLLISQGYNPFKGVENVLTEQAYARGMDFGYLETIDEQFVAISGGSFEDQLTEFVEGISYMDMGKEALDFVIEEWADGDVAGVGLITASPDTLGESREAYERILVTRNRNWIPDIEAILEKPGGHFIAVGAAHLAGPDSVILMLEEKGYEVQRIQ